MELKQTFTLEAEKFTFKCSFLNNICWSEIEIYLQTFDLCEYFISFFIS